MNNIPFNRSAISIRQLNHHVVSIVECNLLHLDCCCVRVESLRWSISDSSKISVLLRFKLVHRTCRNVMYIDRKPMKYMYTVPPKAVDG